MQRWMLLVEDNEDDVLLMRRALGKQGIDAHVVTANDGAEALQVLLHGRGPKFPYAPLPDLVLLDINMPRLNGHEVLECIRSNERTKLLRVVMLTTSKLQADLQRSYAAGVNSYVTKPVNSNGFHKIVDSIGRYWLELNQNSPAFTG